MKIQVTILAGAQALLMGSYLPSLTQAQVITVKAKNGYDKAITVTYDNPNTPRDGDYVALYKGKKVPATDSPGCTAFYLYTCGSQDCDAGLTPPSSGSITFDVTDPSAEDCKQWPPPKGKYQACLGTVNDEGSDEIIACKALRIKRPPKKALTTLTLTMSDEPYEVGDPIKADFTTSKPIRNSWVGVYSSDGSSVEATAMDKLPEPILWVYLGCNNQQGDQTENNDCSVKLTSGSIQIDESSQDRSSGTWPLSAGTYKLCVSLSNNNPHKFFKCFGSFDVNS